MPLPLTQVKLCEFNPHFRGALGANHSFDLNQGHRANCGAR